MPFSLTLNGVKLVPVFEGGHLGVGDVVQAVVVGGLLLPARDAIK